jgi:hypothetical protein
MEGHLIPVDDVVVKIIERCRDVYGDNATITAENIYAFVVLIVEGVEIHSKYSGADKKLMVIAIAHHFNTRDELDILVPPIIESIIFISRNKSALKHINNIKRRCCW